MNKKGHKAIESWDSMLKTLEEGFHRELKEFRRLVKIWRQNQAEIKHTSNQAQILLQYASYIEEANNLDRLKGPFFIKPIKYQQHMKNIKNEKYIFLGINFLENKAWKLNFNKIFLQKLKLFSQKDIIEIFFKLYLWHEGYLNFTQGKMNSLKVCEKMSKFVEHYYTIQIEIDKDIYFLLVSIGVHRIPHYDFNAVNQTKVQWFQHVLMITYEDLIHNSTFYNQKKMRNIIENLQNNYQESPRMNYQRDILKYDEEEMNEKFIYFHSKKRDNRQILVKVYPTLYKKIVPKDLDIQNFAFMNEKFKEHQIRNQFLHFIKNNKEEKLSLIDNQEEEQLENQRMYEILALETAKNQKIQFKNHSKILDNLKKIPNFKYNLTNQQRQVLCSQGNLIVVGRSGTGKTTCAMLRLYGIEFVVKLSEFSSLKKQGKIKQQSQKCIMAILDQIQLMKNIFLTFSGRLIDQIKKQYDDMIYQIKQKHAETCQICKRTFKSNKVEDQQQDPLDKLKRQQEEQQKKVIALDSIKTDDFPGFFTIQNFIRIVDKTISRPFFAHQKNYNYANQVNAIIKHAYINRYKYQEKTIDLVDKSEAVYVDFNFFVNQVWDSLPKQLTKASKQYCLLTPSIVWSQIFSIIKGSLKSYLCPGGYISLKMYVQDHQSVFQKQGQKMYEYKQRVYKIFKSYMNWCRNEQNAYDLMDAVNHILKQIEFYGYSGPKINYMFIDEVQDLTTLTTFLISKMVINNIFYCGDTAQAITKGVSFKFEDLKFIFNQDYCKNAIKLQPPQEIIYLTVNFRSHNFILQLANSVVLSIESLFPSSINKIKKQKSDLLGPKPFLLLNQPKEMLFYLICGPAEEINQQQINGQTNLREIMKESEKREREKIQTKKKKKKNKLKQRKMSQFDEEQMEFYQEDDSQQQLQTRKFNSEQIIIVRNIEEKQKLPSSLKRGIVLTPENAKGLQFDEVIFYNFFSSCPIFQKWNALLEHLQPEYYYQNQKQFQQELSRRSQEQKEVDEPLTEEIKRLLGYDSEKKSYKIWNLKAKDSLKGITINIYHQLASQLKILYTVITRARSVFVIYDEKIPKNLLKLWQGLNLITTVNEDNVQQCNSQIYQYVQVKQIHKKYINEDTHWFKAGSQMLARKDYDNAKKCFQNIQRYDLVDRIIALQMEIKAENQLYRINNGLKNLANLSRDDRKINKIKLEKERKQTLKLFISAGKIYEKYHRYNDAAEAFFKAEQYEFSLKYYRQVEKSDKIAICCKKLKRYKQALKIFKQTNDIEGMIGCHIQEKNWNQLFNLLINNQEYISQFPQLNKIVFGCIKEVLNQTVHSEKVKGWEEYYNNFYGLQMQQQVLSNKKIYSQTEYSSQIKKITLEAQYYNLKNLQNKLQKERVKYQTLKQAYHGYKAKLQILQEQQKNVIEKYDEFKVKRDRASRKLEIIKQNMVIEQMKCKLDDPTQSKIYQRLQKDLAQLEVQRNQIYKQNTMIQEELNRIHGCIISLEPLQQNARIEFEQFTKRYDYKRTQLGLSYLARRLKQVITEFIEQSKKNQAEKNQKKQKKHKKPTNQNYNQDFEIVSSSDISQMTDIWDENENIGGLHLFPLQKENLVNQITQKLIVASKLIEYQVENTYPPFHHKYIQQKLFKYLIEISTSQKYQSLMKIRQCNKIQENRVCLLLCDYQKEFICLAPKYILGFLLQSSQNFTENRHFSNEIYQITAIKQDQAEESQQNLTTAEKFLATLNNNGLQHKVPRLGFQGKFYYQTIVSQVAYGLILQGYFKQALVFSRPGPACKIAYLFSSYEKLVHYIKQIASELKVRNLFDKTFLFTEDQRILHYYPEADSLNIFSIQSILYAYDQCQIEPFLSKKKTSKQIDIQEELVEKFYNQIADLKIRRMLKEKEDYQFQISRLRQEIYQFQECLKYQKNQKYFSDRIYGSQIKKSKNQINQLMFAMQELSNQLDSLSIRQAKAQHELNKVTIPKKVKEQYQKDLQSLLFRIDELKKQGKVLDSQRLRKKRMEIDQEYKYKRIEQKSAYQDYEKIKVRVKQKQTDINNIRQKIRDINFQIKQYQECMNSLTQQEINNYYKKFIEENKAKMQSINKIIPVQLQIKDSEKLKDAVVKLLMRQEQEKRYKIQVQKITKQNMENILQNSNIPKTTHFKFLTLYMKGQLSLRNSKRETDYRTISQIFQKILYDGINLQKLQKPKQNKQIANIKICNVIIFYLSYICNASYRQDINDFVRQATQIYAQNYIKRQQLQSQIKRVQINIEYCKAKLQQIPAKLRVKANRDYNNYSYHFDNQKVKLVQYQRMLEECQGFREDPRILLQNFMNTLFKKIKTLQVSQMHFMELLFGFFQCRLIRNCEILDFLANEYVLVKHNSIVVEQLLKLQQRKHIFAYYFDQQNTTMLCRFEDIQSVILGFIQQKHELLYTTSYQMAQKQIHQKTKKKYMDQQILGYKNNQQNPQNRTLMELTQFINHQNIHEYRSIKSHYDNLFIGDSMMREIKHFKREALQFLLKSKHEKSDQYYFASHQIREYYFLEKVMANMKTFNYEILKQAKKKKELLRSQFEKYIKQMK